jgi:hypothetical protein
VSSNNRHHRSNQPRQDPVPAEPQYDDVLYEDEWDVETDFEDSYPAQQADPRPSTPRRQRPASTTTSAIQGTAAQLDRLRRNLRQSSRSPGNASPPSQAQQRTQQTGRYAVPDDDVVFEDPPHREMSDAYQQPAPVSRTSNRPAPPRIRRGATSPSPARDDRYEPDPFDTSYEADVAGYDDYDDDFSEYDEPRTRDRAPRQSPQVRMPTISRPTLPAAIANADLVNDAPALGIIGAGLASLAAMAILVANQVDSLAPQFATHVSASGILEDFRSESALWNIPLMAGMFTLMGIVMAWFISPIDRFASRFVLAGALVVQFVAWVAIIRIL